MTVIEKEVYLKKIAIIRTTSSYLNFEMYNVQELGLAKELVKLGYIIDIFSANNAFIDDLVEYSDSIRIYRLKCISFPGQNGFFPTLNGYLNDNKYDLIQVSEESQITSITTSIYSRRNKIPLVVLQGMYKEYSGIFKKSLQVAFDKLFLPILKKNYAIALCKTSYAEKYLQSKGFKRTNVVGVGFDNSRFYSQVSSNDIESNFILPKNKKIFLYVGKLEERRNPHFLLDLFENDRLRNEAILILIGSGPLEYEISLRLNEQKFQNIIFHIHSLSQEELKSFYDKADVFLLPTNYEIFGMVVMEAMFFGLPIIATKTAGTDYLINNGITGYLLDSIKYVEWIDILLKMLNDNKIEKMSENAKLKALDFSWKVVSHKYEIEYKKVFKNYYLDNDHK